MIDPHVDPERDHKMRVLSPDSSSSRYYLIYCVGCGWTGETLAMSIHATWQEHLGVVGAIRAQHFRAIRRAHQHLPYFQ